MRTAGAKYLNPDQIREKLKLADELRAAGKPIHEVSRILGITDSTLYNWRKRYVGGRDDKDAQIRISFKQDGSWAFLGKDSLAIPDSEPNVNFGWLTGKSSREEVEMVVIHEFGHVLGLQHEHSNPASTLEWDRPAVYKLFAGPPNFWSRDIVDQHVFAIWPPAYFPIHKVFDRESIMMYEMPADYFVDKNAITRNSQLSALDKQFVAAFYPLRSDER